MKKVIIIRVCEIFLKGKNRFYFINLLEEHIKKALTGIDYEFEKMQMRYLIENFDENDYDEIIDRLKKVCGIHTISPALCVESSRENIAECAKELCKDKTGTFKIETNRADKTFPYHSVELSALIGGDVLSVYGKNLKVDVKKPRFLINVDIRENGKSLIFTDYIKGIGGMPTGSSGKGFLMLSGGIDSPVAGYMMCKRGMKLSAVHFHSYPYTGEAAKEKVIILGKMISAYCAAIHEKCAEELMITLMRRFMMRITEKLAEKHGGQSIITGESLGQVASQTMESINSSNSVVKMPVFRPLIAFDKLETIEIAQKIDTYETSILPYEDCCTVFLPKFPAIKPKMEKILKEESKLDVDALINEALETVEVIKL